MSIELQRHLYKRIYSIFHPSRQIARALPLHFAQGMDGARYQVTFDPDKATIPLSFAIQKISEGTTYKDPTIDELWKGVSKMKVRGGYHYMRSGMSWSAQVDNYLSGIKTHNLHACDLEGYGNTYSDTMFADTRRWIDAVRLATGEKVLLYTNGSTYTLFAAAIKRLYADGKQWLDNLDLWLAWPSTTASEPPLQYERGTAVLPWTVWQDNWNCTKCGCLVASDHNFFNGTEAQLFAWAGVDDTPTPPPPTGEQMERKVLAFINIRPSAGNTTNDLGDLNAGDIIKVIASQNVTTGLYPGLWYRLEQVTRVNGDIAVPASGEWWCWGKNTEEYIAPVPPPPSGPPTLHIRSDGNDIYPAFDFEVKPK